MPCRADSPRAKRRFSVQRLDVAQFIDQPIIHVQHAQVMVGCSKDSSSVGLTFRLRIAPVQRQLLSRVTLDLRHSNPDACRSSNCIPVVDLISQIRAVGRKANVLPARLRAGKIKEVPMQMNQHRDVFLRGRLGQIRTLGSRQKKDRTGVAPTIKLSQCVGNRKQSTQDENG